jgi:GT2 family glycosyltransferase
MLLRAIPPDAVPATVTRLGTDVVLAIVDAGERHAPRHFGGRRIAPPHGTVAVDGARGPSRIAAFRLPPDDPSGAADAAGLEIIDISPHALAAELTRESQCRLLAFLLGFCRTAFRLGNDPLFAAQCRQLADLVAEAVGEATPIASLLTDHVLLDGVAAPVGAPLYLLGDTRVLLAADAVGVGDVHVIETPCAGEILLAIDSGTAMTWALAPPHAKLPPALMLLRDRADARPACLRALAGTAAGTPGADLLRALQLTAPAEALAHDDSGQPIGGALELALSDGGENLFLSGWLRDPRDLLAGATLVTPAGEMPIALEAFHRVFRPDLAAKLRRSAGFGTVQRPGFVSLVPDPMRGRALQAELRLELRAGAAMTLVSPLMPHDAAAARDAVLGSVTPASLTPDLLSGCLAPAARALHRRAGAGRGRATTTQFGTPVARPALSVIVPLYRMLGFLRFQLAAFAADPAFRDVEVIYVLDSPEQQEEAEHLLQGLAHLHALPMTLVTMAANGGFAAANNEAAEFARAPLLLLLNSDVVPAAPGWLAPLLAAAARDVIAAPKLLFDDGSIQHAGLFFVRDHENIWYNRHYHKGMPDFWPAANLAGPVPGATGAALLIDRARYERLGGICEDYIVGDYEDSDFCLRHREAGGHITYAPQSKLYHFERRSIRHHAGYTKTLASQVNRHLQHTRWDDAIAALMARPEFAAPGIGLCA